MESEEGYDEALNILVKDRNLPDIFLVSDRETLEELVENDLIEDLTDVYKSCASDRIREMYKRPESAGYFSGVGQGNTGGTG